MITLTLSENFKWPNKMNNRGVSTGVSSLYDDREGGRGGYLHFISLSSEVGIK